MDKKPAQKLVGVTFEVVLADYVNRLSLQLQCHFEKRRQNSPYDAFLKKRDEEQSRRQFWIKAQTLEGTFLVAWAGVEGAAE